MFLYHHCYYWQEKILSSGIKKRANDAATADA